MRDPLVSIVTPSFNQAEFLEKTILSVINQDYPRLEYFVMDGGSTDGSLEIIKRYEHRITNWISEPDRGQSDAINKGWSMASGDIFAWLNSDDMYAPGAVQAAVQAFRENPEAGMVYGDAILVDRDGHELSIKKSKQIRVQRSPWLGSPIPSNFLIPQPSVFIRADILRQVGFLDSKLHAVMDFELFLRVARVSPIVYLPRIQSYAHWYIGTKTTKNIDRNMREKVEVLKRYSRVWFLSEYWFRYLRYLIWMRMPVTFRNYFRKKRGLVRDQIFLKTVDS